MASSAKLTPSSEPLPGAALLVVIFDVSFLSGSYSSQRETIIPSVVIANVTIKNELARTINDTTITNLTVAGLPLALYFESVLVGPHQSKQERVALPVGPATGSETAVIRVGNRSYSFSPNLENAVFTNLGDVTGDVTVTVSSPCPSGNPPPPAIYVTVTTTTGLDDSGACLEPIST